MATLDGVLDRLTRKQAAIGRARPLPQATLRDLLDDFVVRYAHETTAIAGNGLTLDETRAVLGRGAAVSGRSLPEHREVVNVASAWRWLQQAVQPGTPLDEETIQLLHGVLLAGVAGVAAGRYRTVPVFIAGSPHVPPDPAEVPQRMARFVQRFRERPAGGHAVAYAARAHAELAGIHPFVNGNGRVGRMLVNLLLLRNGWPPALYMAVNRAEYIAGLEEAESRSRLDRFVRVTAEAAEWTLDRYLEAIARVRASAPGNQPARSRT